MKSVFLLIMTGFCFIAYGQKQKSTIPRNFVNNYYQAYSDVPTAERLLHFYADSVVIDDPTYDWVGRSKEGIFRNFTQNNVNNHYTWRVDQQIACGDTLVTEGLLQALYAGAPYTMRFVNIFHFKDGKIIRQYDYYDNREWYSVVEAHNRKRTREKDEATLRHLKQVEWPKAYREQDTVLLDRILADEFQMIGSDGESSNKRDQLEYIKAHKPTYISFEFKIERLDIFDNNTAVVSGTGTIRNKDKQGVYNLVYQSSNILIKRNGQWKAISSHTSGDKVVRVKQ
ncbi:nuclear transport factor 2 family protein [Fulvivirgaceae bacterium PWU4]|uniref:Nuclear transport factor 2 family protein n=1 Tax=Chryseosolibacter histidini TaxID=2782349 RepID=A0AAP2GQ56_9BACT|nr:nuclear transport factor 2 family protein [Chryseosolibacter histidini]MBT1698152.1 nuclear transport factor 2 family protein [Chryseosolibacter histidini]